MAKRRRSNGMGMWWTIAVVVAFVVLLAWSLSARRAETPGLPASQPGARALSESHDAPEAGHGEITNDEKKDLDQIIREGGAAKH